MPSSLIQTWSVTHLSPPPLCGYEISSAIEYARTPVAADAANHFARPRGRNAWSRPATSGMKTRIVSVTSGARDQEVEEHGAGSHEQQQRVGPQVAGLNPAREGAAGADHAARAADDEA